MDKIIPIINTEINIHFIENYDDIYANEIERANYIIERLYYDYRLYYSFSFTKLNELPLEFKKKLDKNDNPLEYIISITSNSNSSIRKVFDFRKRNSKTIKIYPYVIFDFNEYKV
jgi:hypothetical protein